MKRWALERIGGTPLVHLRRISADLDVPIFGKCEHLNLTGSIKDRAALAMIRAAEADGTLRPGGAIIEPSAGNTGISLAAIGGLLGYKVTCVMPATMSPRKRGMMGALGAEVILTPRVRPGHPEHFLEVAARLADQRAAVFLNQFENPANVAAHYEGTGPEILREIPTVGALVAGCGSGGTIMGAGRALRETRADTRIVLADPVGSAIADYVRTGTPGPTSDYRVEGIGWWTRPKLLDRAVVDEAVSISDDQAFAMQRRLVREEGLLVGASAGLATVVALRVARKGRLRGPVVVVLPEAWDRGGEARLVERRQRPGARSQRPVPLDLGQGSLGKEGLVV